MKINGNSEVNATDVSLNSRRIEEARIIRYLRVYFLNNGRMIERVNHGI